jgi:hypothetical protein
VKYFKLLGMAFEIDYQYQYWLRNDQRGDYYFWRVIDNPVDMKKLTSAHFWG